MQTLKENLILGALAVCLTFGLAMPIAGLAATTPGLGSATTYGVLGGTYTNTSAATTVSGDVGFTTGPAQTPLGVHTNYGSGDPTPTARINAASALSIGLDTQACTPAFTFGVATDLSLLSQPLTPGVYCITGATSIGTGGITLTGVGTYIFRITGALTSADNSHVTLSPGVSACDVFWTPSAATTLGATTTFAGTIIDNANAITVGANTVWTGRALSLGAGTVTTGSTSTITAPTCTVTPAPATGGGQTHQLTGTITVVKMVINDNGRTKTVADFPLFINGLPVASGVANNFSFTSTVPYAVTETVDPNYTQTFSGDCDANGVVYLGGSQNKFCIITNNDIGAPVATPPVPPLIDLVKVPNPLSLPNGPGTVTYTYTLRNIGTVPVTNITMVGDTCSPINLVSGDTNTDTKLDVNETWTYKCATTLQDTHTNIVTATGWANGISATDIASATVIVGTPTVPPLIHVTKVPNPLALPSAGDMVTYTEKVTNPGAVALSNVKLTDDKCSAVKYISGDTNRNAKLDTTETWVYTCRTKLTGTTTNTATASGEANGFTVRDFAVATVVVATAIPKLPNTGVGPLIDSNVWSIIMLSGIFTLGVTTLVLVLKKRMI